MVDGVNAEVPLETLVEQLAEVMISNPAYRITNRERAMEYFRGMARNRLAATTDPLARGSLVGSARHSTAKDGIK